MSSAPFGFSLEQQEDVGVPETPGRPLTIQVLVTIVGVFTISAVANSALGFVVGPRMFRERVADSTAIPESVKAEVLHLYAVTTLAQTFVGILTGLAVWTVFAVLTARSLARSVATMQRAAELVAAGRYDFALHAAQLGPEAEGFARTFNGMAARLHEVETTRRRMLSDLAHELRTPIATIDGYLEAFEDGLAEPDPATLQMLRGQTRRLARLVKDVSAVSRAEEHVEPLVLVPTAPADLVGAAVHSIEAAVAARGLSIETRIARGLPLVSVDRERMEQVLTNLLDNAVRHARSAITVAAERSGDGIRIRVRDDGDGIPAESLPHVFERFYRADSARDRGSGGSGIGLAIAKALVGAHGGRITADSEGRGTGATFTITLPASRATA
ncbi:MAG TPA: HAMP domain-containing sensor histidine kinase [Dermatophilaceae bacterium]|nr:HAMP domain-containing sensor histidine kinase [Dermatophilaceae bacterium]